MVWNRSRDGGRDAALALLIFAGTVLYLSWLPRNLTAADESIHLYEAKRILDGEVLYRDVFEMITPGFMYLMALLFRLFGTDFATARIAQAVLHGIAAVALYYACRKLDIRRGLCVAGRAGVPGRSARRPGRWSASTGCRRCSASLLLLVCIDLRARPRRRDAAAGSGAGAAHRRPAPARRDHGRRRLRLDHRRHARAAPPASRTSRRRRCWRAWPG